jgi:uncharacterized repeat protein (TIGR03803 family)
MKTKIEKLFVLPALIAVFNFLSEGPMAAQSGIMINNDGAFPVAGLVLSGTMLYGTAQAGGTSGHGTVFSINIGGTGFTGLHSLSGNDGMTPYARLAASSNALYGTANCGGVAGGGTIFQLNTNGTGFMSLYTFTEPSDSASTNSDGADPYAPLLLSGNILYGTTEEGGSGGGGTVFAVKTDGTQFVNLHSFTPTSSSSVDGTNSDGSAPQAGLVRSGKTLYGTAFAGGSAGGGTVFKVNIDGTHFRTLYHFASIRTNASGIYTNHAGANPHAELVLSGHTLYGTAMNGGASGNGTVFALHTDGTCFRVLHTFNELANHTNDDGAVPLAGLVLKECILYGAAQYGGTFGNGTIFALNTDGTNFRNLHSFTFLHFNGMMGTNADGTYPYGTLVLSGNTLYGTAVFGGDSGDGTVFSVNIDGTGFATLHSFTRLVRSLPQLTITKSGSQVVLKWPIHVPGTPAFTLQFAWEPSPWGGWDYFSYTSYIAGGLNIASIPAWSAQKFYRLIELSGPGEGCASNRDCASGTMCIWGTCMTVFGGGGGLGFGFGFGGGGVNGIFCCGG